VQGPSGPGSRTHQPERRRHRAGPPTGRQRGHDGSRYRVEENYRDGKIAEIYEGTNEIQKLGSARNIFGKDVTS